MPRTIDIPKLTPDLEDLLQALEDSRVDAENLAQQSSGDVVLEDGTDTGAPSALVLRNQSRNARDESRTARDDAEQTAKDLGALGGIDGTVQATSDLPSSTGSGDYYFVVDQAAYYKDTGNGAVQGGWTQSGPNLAALDVRQTWGARQDLKRATFEEGPVYDACHPTFGAAPSKSKSTNRQALQDAIDKAAAAGGGTVTLSQEGTYDLAAVSTPSGWPSQTMDQYCVKITDPNIHLEIPPHVTLRLGDNEQNDTDGPVSVILAGYDASVENILIDGGGRIVGNTAGQPNWTGGYQQRSAGNIIQLIYDTNNDIRRVAIRDLELDDHFSNPVFGTFESGASGTIEHFELKNVISSNMGEGYQVVQTKYSEWQNVTFLDLNGTCVGDAFEPAGEHLIIDGVIVVGSQTSGVGSVVDMLGTDRAIISNVYADTWNSGIHTTGSKVSEDVLVTNANFKNLGGIAFAFGGGGGKTKISGALIDGCRKVIQHDQPKTQEAIHLSDVVARNSSETTYRMIGGSYVLENCWSINSADHGFDFLDSSANEVDFQIIGGGATGAANHGINLDGRDGNPYDPSGRIVGADFSGNGGKPWTRESGGRFRQIEFKDVRPQVAPGGFLPGYEVIEVGANLTGTFEGSKNQTLVVRRDSGAISVQDASNGSNFQIAEGLDLVLFGPGAITLRYDEANNVWHEVSRSVQNQTFQISSGATPSFQFANAKVIQMNYSSSTTITDITDVPTGRQFTIVFPEGGTPNVTFDFSASNLVGQSPGGTDSWTPAGGDHMLVAEYEGKKFCTPVDNTKTQQ